MAYSKTTWQDLPNTTTQINATNLNNIETGVENNDKRLNGTSSAGSMVVESIRTKNMFNKNGNNALDGAYVNATNNTIGSNSNTKCVYIEINPSTTYTISKTKGNRFAVGFSNTLPEINTALTGVIDNSSATSLTSTSGASSKYLVVYVYNSGVDTETFESIIATLQIEEGISATEYTSYQELNPQNFKNEEIVVGSIRSKNLATTNNNFYKNGSVIEDIRLIKLSANKTYCISYYTNLNTSSTAWYFKDANKNNVFNFTIYNSTSRVSKTFTPTQDIYFVGAFMNDTSVEVYDLQIEESDTETSYSPYQDLSKTDEFVIASSPTTNLNVSYYGRSLHYKKMGNVVFYQILINTREDSTSTENFELTLPFITAGNWFFPLIKASKDNSFYLFCEKGTNKAYLTTSTNRTKAKCNAVGHGYVIDCEFFAFVMD